MYTTLLQMLLGITMGLGAALLLRKPLRHAFGAEPAFLIWCLPWLLALLPLLPMPIAQWSATPMVVVSPVRHLMQMAATPTASEHPWFALWLLGACIALYRLAVHYARLAQGCTTVRGEFKRALQREYPHLDHDRMRVNMHGPAVLWAPRSLLLVPADFLERYDTDARYFILQHECMHLRRHDAWWCLVGELTRALLWFHPLAWLALPRMQLDQELACDEALLRYSPHHEAAYARTLLKSNGVDAQPALIPWLTEPQLKERLTMIHKARTSALRRRLGYIALLALLTASSAIAQTAAPMATQGAQSDRDAAPDIDFNSAKDRQPAYPKNAVDSKQQGIVILNVAVGADGKPRTVDIDGAGTTASPELAKSAAEAVNQWRFHPALHDGKPVASVIKVPVAFSLMPLNVPPPPPPPPPGSMPPPPPPPPLPPSSSNS